MVAELFSQPILVQLFVCLSCCL